MSSRGPNLGCWLFTFAQSRRHITKLSIARLTDASATGANEQMLSDSLVAALERGDVSAIRQALKGGMSPDERDSEWWPALKIASRAGHLEVVECLLTAGADVDGFAEVEGEDDTGDVPIDVNGMTVIEAEQAYAALDMASPLRPWREKLIDKYHDDPALTLDACEDPLTTAIVFGHGLIARVLVQAGAELSRDTCPLYLAAATGRIDLIELLLDAGAPVQPANVVESPLMAATMRGHLDAICALLAAGADVDNGDLSGHTPLMAAAAVGAMDMAQILIDAGADPERETRDGYSALTIASEQGHKELYTYLVKCIRV